MALGFAVGSRGADHNRSGAYEVDFSARVDRLNGTPEAARLAVETEDRAALMDSLILCKFLRGIFSDLYAESAELLSLVTGWNVHANELRTVSRRVVTAKKLYNIREGWTCEEDTLPRRFLMESQNGAAAISSDRLQTMVQSYYEARGWNGAGFVPSKRLAELGLTAL
jgi:aldehyde:ferredoxin oxidoreductase